MHQGNIYSPRRKNDLTVQDIYNLFLDKINYSPVCLYEKAITTKEKGKIITKMSQELKLERETLNITLSLCLQGFVMWKDNIFHRDEVRMAKLSYTLLKQCFPKENIYHEVEMNNHLSGFLTFLMSDFDLLYLTEILYFLYENPLIINRAEMKFQLEIVSKIDGLEDPREIDIINDIIACFYDKKISVDEFIQKLKKGLDFKALRKSAENFPELKLYLN